MVGFLGFFCCSFVRLFILKNIPVLLFRLLLRFEYTINLPPDLLIIHPGKLRFCEAFVSQIKTLLEPKIVAGGYL